MKLHHTLLAVAIALVATPAFATNNPDPGSDESNDDARISSDTYLKNRVTVKGDPTVYGRIRVNAESKAIVDQDQTTCGNQSYGDGDNTASASNRAMSNASGNLGLNIAAGVVNAQTNDTALAAIDGENIFAAAQVFNSQTTLVNGNVDGGRSDSVHNDASIGDNVLAGASGNIGVNIGAGVGNAQSNGMAASVNSSGNLAWATADSLQQTEANGLGAWHDLDNVASLSGNALSGASGNIGVNIAAGVGNAQHNGLAIAVASCGSGAAPPPPPPPCGGCGGDT